MGFNVKTRAGLSLEMFNHKVNQKIGKKKFQTVCKEVALKLCKDTLL